MESKGNDALLTATKITEFNVNQGGYIPIAFGVLIFAGCAVAYAIAVARGNVEAVLPLISDAAGSPPQNGIFGTMICIGGMLGVVFMIQRYMIVVEKNKEKSKVAAAVNKLSLGSGILSMLGITLITGYPLNFYRNRDVWLKDVGLPHMIGGIMLFAFGLIYIALQCALTLQLKQKKECALTIRVLLFLACSVSFVYHMMTVPDNFGGLAHLYYFNSTGVDTNSTNLMPYPPTLGSDLKLPIDTSGSYFTSAVSEWAFVICFCCFFFTFYSETQEYSLQIVIETHTTQEAEISEEPKVDFRKTSLHPKVDAKPPPPEMRKFLRRDSTCQTSDGPEKIMKPSMDIISAKRNGTRNSLMESELDAKLHKLLSKVEKNGSTKVRENGGQHSISTSTQDEDIVKNGSTKVIENGGQHSISTSTQDEDVVKNGSIKVIENGGQHSISTSTQDEDIVKNGSTKVLENGGQHSISTSTQDEDIVENGMSDAERSVIEKIEIVVKNAEDESRAKMSAKEMADDEEKPSNCPLAVQ